MPTTTEKQRAIREIVLPLAKAIIVDYNVKYFEVETIEKLLRKYGCDTLKELTTQHAYLRIRGTHNIKVDFLSSWAIKYLDKNEKRFSSNYPESISEYAANSIVLEKQDGEYKLLIGAELNEDIFEDWMWRELEYLVFSPQQRYLTKLNKYL